MEIKVPALGESVTEATVARWLKQAGDTVQADEPLVELETDKVSLEVPAPSAGTLTEITAEEGAEVEVGAILGMLQEGEVKAPAKTNGAKAEADAGKKAEVQAEEAETPKAAGATPERTEAKAGAERPAATTDHIGPAARKLMAEKGLSPEDVPGTGPKGNITKADVARAEAPSAKPAAPAEAKAPAPSSGPRGREERVKMTRLRKRIAERLKEAQNTAAMLTTFNEVDMTAVMELRKAYQDQFVKKYDIKLGFMSFFVKACIEALKDFPAVNAEIDGDEIVYKHYYDIGVAVSTDTGLVVPVVRDADALNLAQIEGAIADLGKRARVGKVSIQEMQGGTFTITNGGIFGSMMSTPILNPPQVGILGMHNIVQRPMVVNGEIKVRPMMYLALSYDHRIVDGKEAVSFLVKVKQCIEDPARVVLSV